MKDSKQYVYAINIIATQYITIRAKKCLCHQFQFYTDDFDKKNDHFTSSVLIILLAFHLQVYAS